MKRLTAEDKIKEFSVYMRKTRTSLNAAMKSDSEYNTSTGNGVNCCEANAMFEEVEKMWKLIKEL